MNSVPLHQRIILMTCAMILFSGNSLLAFQPEPDLQVESSSKKYIGLTLSQNFAYRNYTESYYYFYFDLYRFNTVTVPSISFGVHLEHQLSNHPKSASLKFKLLYEQFNSKLNLLNSFYKARSNDSNNSGPFMLNNEHSIKQYSLQLFYLQRLFSTNLSLHYGGTLAFVQNNTYKEYYTLNSLKDTALFTSDDRPSDQYFSEDYTKFVLTNFDRSPDIRYSLNLGMQYDLEFDNFKIVPFVQYNHYFNSINVNLNLLSFQTGLDFSFSLGK